MAAFRTLICGSPQPEGKCAQAASHLAEFLQQRFPEDNTLAFTVSKGRVSKGRGIWHAGDDAQTTTPVSDRVLRCLDVAPCIGCNRCADGGGCFMHDGMDELIDALAQSAELYVVSPVYFAGPPAQMKAVLDRFQPLFYTDVRTHPKREAHLLVVGGGGDPHGYEPLVAIARSALSVAGFRLVNVETSIGEELTATLAAAERLLP